VAIEGRGWGAELPVHVEDGAERRRFARGVPIVELGASRVEVVGVEHHDQVLTTVGIDPDDLEQLDLARSDGVAGPRPGQAPEREPMAAGAEYLRGEAGRGHCEDGAE